MGCTGLSACVPPVANLPAWMDEGKARRIAQLRALGYTQKQIADQVGVSQQTVSRYLAEIRGAADNADDLEKFLLALLLGSAALAFLSELAKQLE